MKYLETEGKEDDSIEVLTSWVKAQHEGDAATSVRSMKGMLTVGMDMNREKQIGVYSEDDITVNTRNGELEVWANRDFKANTCIFVAEASELKDRFWNTIQGCAMTTGGTKKHPDKKNLVIDGRLTAGPMDDACIPT